MMQAAVCSFWILAVLSPCCFAKPSNAIPLGEGTGLQLGGGEDSFLESNSLPDEESNNVIQINSLEGIQEMMMEKMGEAMMSNMALKVEMEALREENARLSARLNSVEDQITGVENLQYRMDNVETNLEILAGSSTGSFERLVQTTTPPTHDVYTTDMEYDTTPYYFRRTTQGRRISNSPGLVTYILVTEEGQVLLADYNQQEIKVTASDDINRLVQTFDLGMTPWSMTQLADGTVIVTCENEPKMSFLRIQDSGLEAERTISLDRRYRGIAECGNGTLIASSRRNMDDYPDLDANINVITRDGEVVETLLSGADYEDLDKPFFLTCRGHDLFISDWTSHRVIVLNTETREVTSSFGDMNLSDLDLYQPRVVAFDQHENMYVATGGKVCNKYYSGSWCVIQVSPNGQWKNLHQYRATGGTYPYSVAVTDTQIFISWGSWKYGTWYTYLTTYPLPQPLEEATTITPEESTELTHESEGTTIPSDGEYTSGSTSFYIYEYWPGSSAQKRNQQYYAYNIHWTPTDVRLGSQALL